MFEFFSKTEDQCSQAMKQPVKETFENNIHHHDTMKIIAKAYLTVEKVLYTMQFTIFLPELKLRRIFLAVYFVNTNLPR